MPAVSQLLPKLKIELFPFSYHNEIFKRNLPAALYNLQ